MSCNTNITLTVLVAVRLAYWLPVECENITYSTKIIYKTNITYSTKITFNTKITTKNYLHQHCLQY